MKLLLNRPVLWHVVKRVSKARLIEGLIVATTTNPTDQAIWDFCKSNRILVFRGSEDDVLDRYYRCAKKYNIGNVVRITADCPLHDPGVIDFVCKDYLSGNYDYVSNILKYTFPDGLDVEVFSFEALENAWENARLPSEREHVTPYIQNNARFKKKNVCSVRKYPIYRLTLDCPEDYQFIKKVYDGIGKEAFYLDDVIKFLEKNPKLLEINQYFEINEGYAKSVEADKTYKGHNSIIETRRTYLRELREEDASQEYCEWLNDPTVNKFLETKSETVKGLKLYIKSKRESPDCLFLGIFSKDTDRHIGNVKLEPIDRNDKKVVLGVLIGNKSYWGRGIYTEVIKSVTEYAFSNLGLEKVCLGVISENKAAIRCYQKAGFRIDTTERRAIRYGGRLYDKVIMSVKNHSARNEVLESK